MSHFVNATSLDTVRIEVVGDARAVTCPGSVWVEFRDKTYETRNEIASVLELLDNLASVWGDEGVFRRCRDRLRALTEGKP